MLRRVNLQQATAAAIAMMTADLGVGVVNPASPDGDVGKFTVAGVPARVIIQRDGYYLNTNPGWFRGDDAPAQIIGGPIGIYVFVLPGTPLRYWACSWQRLRDLALDFRGESLPHYQVTTRWRADLHVIRDAPDAVLFRWGDEIAAVQLMRPSRIMDLGNASALLPEPSVVGGSAGARARGGEGLAHRLLKDYLAAHPELVGVSAQASVHKEYRFPTGDRVDVMFQNHLPNRTVVEIEVEGRDNLIVGVHQAVKYAALAGVEAGYPVVSHRVRAHVVAYNVQYPEVIQLADRYGVNLVAVRPELCLVA
jgi:hypothetical protein